jgi:hypothetical protein
MIKQSIKTYSIVSGYIRGKKRLSCTCDGEKIKLHSANKGFDMPESCKFRKSVFTDFSMEDNTEIKFIFK